LPTVASGVRVQFSPQSGPTQFRSHTSAAFAGSDKRAEPVNAAATAKARAVRISISIEFSTQVNAPVRSCSNLPNNSYNLAVLRIDGKKVTKINEIEATGVKGTRLRTPASGPR
jgi:hypothetical protein